jgi:hypothetical protein
MQLNDMTDYNTFSSAQSMEDEHNHLSYHWTYINNLIFIYI